MNDTVSQSPAEPPQTPPPPAPTVAAAPAVAAAPRWLAPAVAVIAVLGALGLGAAWQARQRVIALEQELVRRQQDSSAQSTEARVMARQAQEGARDAAAKVALLEARVAENALQRSQLEELIQAMSRSRDENLLSDLDAALRVAVQQSALTGSAEPLVAALRQAEERLSRNPQPRLERVRRALTHDLDRARASGIADVGTLTIRLDEVVRLVDELPLLAQADRRPTGRDVQPAAPARAAAAASGATRAAASAAPAAAGSLGEGWAALRASWQALAERATDEIRSLVRVTRIEHPEAMLAAPEQAWFLRENLKLRLLNARLAILSRQFDTAQSDLRDAQASLERYFDRNSRRVATALDLVRQVSGQARLVVVPRPDETLAALAALQAGR